MIRARNPVLLVETQEPDRVVSAIESIISSGVIPRGRQLVLYSLTRGLHSPGGNPGKRALPEDALLETMKVAQPTVFVFQDLHHQLGANGRPAEPAVIRAVLDVATEFRSGPIAHTLVIVAPQITLPVDLEKTVSVIDLPLPTEAEIGKALDNFLETNEGSIRVNLSDSDRRRMVQAAQGLTLGEAENAFARAVVSDRVLDESDVGLILEEKRQTIRKSGLLEFVPSKVSLDEIGGLDNLKRWLMRRDSAWQSDASDWGVPAPKGLLVTGVPGCGKSLTAAAVSAQWGLPLLRLDIGRVFSGLVGSSEQNMRNALRLAEAVAPSILWIDEIEKGFGTARQSGGDSGTSTRVLGTFLTWMQEKQAPVFVMATANKIDALPPEFLRKGRFDEIFFVDLPTAEERREIWRVHLADHLNPPSRAGGIVDPQNVDALQELSSASEGFSGAEIAQAVISSCFDAFADRRSVRQDDLLRSIENTVPLSVTQAEQIRAIREWASERAVSATSKKARSDYLTKPEIGGSPDVSGWRGGRTIEF
ncbi:AAA family ATPase [Pseudoclavibacter sp. CFCC 13796]|nr:AAA family ATPase [Pseudoclavibacter sp. CFCC 13796]